jgi:hypothetical protein
MNLNPNDVIAKIRAYSTRIAELNEEFKQLEIELAQAEYEYRIAKEKKILQLKAEGMQATLIPDLAKGNESVAKLMLERDTAKGLVEAQKFLIYSARDGMSGEQAILKWLGIEYNSSGQ